MASRDRLSELIAIPLDNETKTISFRSLQSPNHFSIDQCSIDFQSQNLDQLVQNYRKMDLLLDSLKNQNDSLQCLQSSFKRITNRRNVESIESSLQEISKSTYAILNQVHIFLSNESKTLEHLEHNSLTTFNVARRNLYQKTLQKSSIFAENFNRLYDDVSNQFKKHQVRMLKIQLPVNTFSSTELEDIVEKKQTQQVLQLAVVEQKRERLQAFVGQLEQRHLDILQLERSFLEIYQLFRDLQTLVDLQAESLDHIEHRVNNAKNHAESGEVKVQDAADYQKKTSKMRCACLLCLLLVLIVVLIPILATRTQSF